jgi:hypothetical protein
VFHKTANSWQAYPAACDNQDCLKASTSKYPAQVTWTVTLDGRNLGRLTSRTHDFSFYSHVGLQEIAEGSPVPTVGNRSSMYSGYRATAVYRPLVTVSQPYFKDPEGWRPTNLSPDFVSLLQQQFRKKFPKLCRADKDETKLTTTASQSCSFQLTGKIGAAMSCFTMDSRITLFSSSVTTKRADQCFCRRPRGNIRAS